MVQLVYTRVKWTVDGCFDDDAFRMLRGLKKSKTVETKNKEGNVYGSGIASWKCKYCQDYLFIQFWFRWKLLKFAFFAVEKLSNVLKIIMSNRNNLGILQYNVINHFCWLHIVYIIRVYYGKKNFICDFSKWPFLIWRRKYFKNHSSN